MFVSTVHRFNDFPADKDLEALTRSTLECDTRKMCGMNLVKTKVFGWSLIWYGSILNLRCVHSKSNGWKHGQGDVCTCHESFHHLQEQSVLTKLWSLQNYVLKVPASSSIDNRFLWFIIHSMLYIVMEGLENEYGTQLKKVRLPLWYICLSMSIALFTN